MKNNNQQKPSPSKKVMVFVNVTKVMLFLIVVSMLALLTFAIPNSLTLQGKLTNLAGASQQGTFTFRFRIYDLPNFTYYNVTQNITLSNGSLVEANITYINYTNILWEQNQSVATDANGVYDVILAGINLSFADQYYLGITIGSDNESVPRVNLTSAPYSFRANTSEDLNANNSYVVTNLSITGNATIGTGGTTLAISTQTFNLTKDGNINLANNITLSDQVRFRFGQVIDNLISGFLRISGNLNVTGNTSIAQNTLFVDNTSSRVGIGTTSPSEALTVIGNVNVSGYVNISGDLIVNKQFNVSSSGNVKIGGGLNVSGNTNISSNLYVVGNAVFGDATSDTIEVNAQVSSDLIPNNNDRDLGSGANFWRRGYIDLLTVNNLSVAETNISGTTSPVFTINSNYSGNDDRDVELVFERGTPTINSVLKWDSANKRFDMNFPLSIQANNNLTVDTNTLFVDGSINRVGIGTTTPTHTLTVVGDINATGAVFSSAVNISGNLNLGTTVNITSSSGDISLAGNLRVGGYVNASGDLNINNRFNVTASSGNAITSGNAYVLGNVGVGTTSPSDKLHVVGAGRIAVNDTNNISTTTVLTLDHFTQNPLNSTGGIGAGILLRAMDNGSNVDDIALINATLVTSLNGSEASAIGFYTRTSGGALTPRLFINGSNVGIGTTAPLDTLTVVGSLAVFGSLNATFINATTLTVTNLNLPASSNSSLWNRSGSNIYPRDFSGNVGINTTTPANTLTVQGTLNITSQPTRSGDLFVASDGNAGFGTTIPAAKLHVNATTTATADFTNIKSGIVFNGEIAMTNWYGAYISAPAGTGTITNKYALVTEANAGNVGINTTTPSSTLQVAGSANITSGSTQFLVNSNGNVIINLKG